MFEMTKDRNLLSIRLYETQTKPYVLDINTGIFLGQQGKPIKSTPKYWRENLARFKQSMPDTHPLSNLVYALYAVVDYNHNIATIFRERNEWRKMLGMCDRFQSINYSMDYISVCALRNTEISDADFKAFAKHRKDHPNDTYSEWERSTKLDKWCAEQHLTIDDHFTRPMAKLLYEGCRNTDNLKWYAYYLARGLYDFGQLAGYGSRILDWIRTYLDAVKKLGQKPQKGDFIRLYTDAVRTYQLRKAEFDNRAIAEHQNSKLHALQFEDENFIVKVPMTSAEFIAEGEAQSNCVGRLYLPKVIEHTRHIVFVRRKSDPETSYITCEVYNDGSIGQYLMRYNNNIPYGGIEHEFKRKYQNFLNENWNRA